MDQETWRPVKGYEGLYEVSSLGNVRRLAGPWCRKTRLLKPTIIDSYPQINLSRDGVSTRHWVHILVARAFLDEPPAPGMEVNHKDGNKANPRQDNLEWMTHAENVKHAWANGLITPNPRFGSDNPSAKLTEAIVVKLRALKPKATYAELAARYGVSPMTVQRAVRGTYWGHVS